MSGKDAGSGSRSRRIGRTMLCFRNRPMRAEPGMPPKGTSMRRLVIDGHRLTPERTGVGRCLESLLADWAETGLPLAETVVVLRERGGLSRVPQAPGLEARVVGEGWPGLAWECLGLGRVLRPDDLLFAPANLV